LAGFGLDAPVIAAAWSFALAQHAGVRPHAASVVALGLAAWWVYLADRAFDLHRMQSPARGVHAALQSRPTFMRIALLVLPVVLLGLTAWVPPVVLSGAAVVATAGAGAWWLGRRTAGSLLAGVRAAGLAAGFTVAAWLPVVPVSDIPIWQVAVWLAPWALLLWFNVRFTETWEWGLDDGRPSATAPKPRVRRLGVDAAVLVAVAAGLAGLTTAIAALPAFVVLRALERSDGPAEMKRVWADAALLLPAGLLPFL
jgi:hypothetical protein